MQWISYFIFEKAMNLLQTIQSSYRFHYSIQLFCHCIFCTGMHNGYSPWLQFKKMMEKLIKHKQNALEMKTHLQKNNSSHYIHSCKVIHFSFNNIFKEKPEATSLNVSWHFILNVHIKLQLKRKITSYFEHANFMLSAIQCSFIRRLHFKRFFVNQ